MKTPGLIAWAVAGTLMTYAAYFFMCGMKGAIGVLVAGGAAIICLLVAFVSCPLVKSVKKRVVVSSAVSYVMLTAAVCFTANLGDPEVRMWLPIGILFIVPLCAPMVLSISYCVAKLMGGLEAKEPTSE
jgi:hypothetical protein